MLKTGTRTEKKRFKKTDKKRQKKTAKKNFFSVIEKVVAHKKLTTFGYHLFLSVFFVLVPKKRSKTRIRHQKNFDPSQNYIKLQKEIRPNRTYLFLLAIFTSFQRVFRRVGIFLTPDSCSSCFFTLRNDVFMRKNLILYKEKLIFQKSGFFGHPVAHY